jgi:hypothetical protein
MGSIALTHKCDTETTQPDREGLPAHNPCDGSPTTRETSNEEASERDQNVSSNLIIRVGFRYRPRNDLTSEHKRRAYEEDGASTCSVDCEDAWE